MESLLQTYPAHVKEVVCHLLGSQPVRHAFNAALVSAVCVPKLIKYVIEDVERGKLERTV